MRELAVPTDFRGQLCTRKSENLPRFRPSRLARAPVSGRGHHHGALPRFSAPHFRAQGREAGPSDMVQDKKKHPNFR